MRSQYGIQPLRRQLGRHAGAAVDEFETLAFKMAWVAAQAGHQFVAGNRKRYVPVRAELDMTHELVELRRARVQRAADDHFHLLAHDDTSLRPYLVGPQNELRQVDDNHPRPLQQGRPAQAFEHQHDLLRALFRAELQRVQGRTAEDAIVAQTVPALERTQRLDQRFVQARRFGHRQRAQVAPGGQPLRQQACTGPVLPRFELGHSPALWRLRQRWQRPIPGRVVAQRPASRQGIAQGSDHRQRWLGRPQRRGQRPGGQGLLHGHDGVEAQPGGCAVGLMQLPGIDATAAQVGQIAQQGSQQRGIKAHHSVAGQRMRRRTV
jgi:hypothetical protein